MSFKTKVEDYLGYTFADTTALDDWLQANVKILVNLIPVSKIGNYTASITVTTSGLSLANYRYVEVHKAGYASEYAEIGMKAAITDANSIHYALDSSPRHYFEGGKLYVVPGGGTVMAMAYPAVTNDATSITNFPVELIDPLVLMTVVKALINGIGVDIAELNALTYTSATAPTAPSASTIIGTLPTLSATTISAITDIVSTIIDSFGTAPTYTAPTASFLDDYTLTEARLTNDDVELANAELNKLKTQLEEYQLKQADSNYEFQELITAYEATVKKLITQAEIKLKEASARFEADTRLKFEQAGITSKERMATYETDAKKVFDQAILTSKETFDLYVSNIQKYAQDINLYTNLFQMNMQKILGKIEPKANQIVTLKNEIKEALEVYINS